MFFKCLLKVNSNNDVIDVDNTFLLQ